MNAHTLNTDILPTPRPHRIRGLVGCLVLLLAAQGMCWWQLKDRTPPMDIVALPPSKTSVAALSLGEEQVFFRLLGMQVQTAGDLFGRFTALYKYDYHRLLDWFRLCDSLDAQSNYIPTLASYYFSQSQFTPDVRYVVTYLREHSEHDLKHKWWWLVQAIYLANHHLKDTELALDMAKELEGQRDLPLWVQQMPAFIHEQRGEMDSALKIMQDIQDNEKDIPQGELNFMQYFVKERIHALDKNHGVESEN